jgi:glycosyltransferase involved in cell wall biosynthesis
MKLLWISQNLPYPPKTGVLQRNYNLIREAAQFAEIHLVAILKEDILPDFDAGTAQRELSKLCSQISVIRLPAESSRLYFLWLAFKSLFTRAPFTANWTESDELRRKLREQTGATRYDLVYFDTISLAGYRLVVGDVAKVLNHHNIESHLFQRRIAYERNVLRRYYFSMEARKLARYEAEVIGDFDLNVTVSELDAERLKEIAASARTSVVANGVDVGYFSGARATARNGRLVMVSGMNWFPNKDAALYMVRDIWPALIASMPELSLTIVGASPPPEVTSLAAADSRVVATGFVDDVRPHMNEAQIYLCPMRDGGGTRLKILDALSMGVPIVATTMALEGIDVVPEHDVLVADDPAAFVRQVKRLVEDPALRANLSANGRSFVERNFSWPVIGRRMQQSFSEVVRARAR